MPDDVRWHDYDSLSSLRNIWPEVNALVHFLAKGVTPQKVGWREAFSINLQLSAEIWQQAIEGGVKRFVIAGSSSEYGGSCEIYDPVPPNAPLEPIGPYACSKASSSLLARSLAIQHDLQLAYIRSFNLYGEGQFEGNFWPSLRRAALAGEDFLMTAGTQVRDFSRVEDAAAFFHYIAADYVLAPGKPLLVNYGSGQPKTLLQYAKHWWNDFGAKGALLPAALPSRPNEPPRIIPLLTIKRPVARSS